MIATQDGLVMKNDVYNIYTWDFGGDPFLIRELKSIDRVRKFGEVARFNASLLASTTRSVCSHVLLDWSHFL